MNTPKFITIATVLLFLVINVNAQITIDGTITDSDLNPISNALVEIIDQDDTTNYYSSKTNESGYFNIVNIFTDISDRATQIPSDFFVLRNYPNPFNPTTIIYYELPKSENIEIKIYDILGREIRTLYNSFHKAGTYRMSWDGRNDWNSPVAAGVYFCRLKTKDQFKVHKMVFLDGGSAFALSSFAKLKKPTQKNISKVNINFNFTIKVSGNNILESEFQYLSCSSDTTLNLLVSKILKSITIGPEGGEIVIDNFSLFVPPAAFDENTEIRIFDKHTNEWDTNNASKIFGVAGLPYYFAHPLNIEITPNANLTDESYIAVGQDYQVPSSNTIEPIYKFLETEDSLGKLSCQLLPDSTLVKSKLGKNLNDRDYFTHKIFFTIKTGFEAYLSYKKHFKIFVINNILNGAKFVSNNVGIQLERNFDSVKTLGFDTVNINWPVEVHIKKLRPELMNRRCVCAHPYGVKNFILLIDETTWVGINYSSMREYAIGVARSYDKIFLQPNEFTGKVNIDRYWFHHAFGSWLEEKIYKLLPGDDLYYPIDYYRYLDVDVDGSGDNRFAPFNGIRVGAGNNPVSALKHGGGMSSLIKYIAHNYGEAPIVSIYELIRNNKLHPIEAIKNLLPNPEIWWNDYLEELIDNKLYEFDTEKAFAYYDVGTVINTIEEGYKFKDILDTIKVFKDIGFPSLSAKSFHIEWDASKIDTNRVIKVSLIDNENLLLVYGGTKEEHYTLLGKGAIFKMKLSELLRLENDGTPIDHVVVVVTNAENNPPYTNTTNISLEVHLEKIKELQFNACTIKVRAMGIWERHRIPPPPDTSPTIDTMGYIAEWNTIGNFTGDTFEGVLEPSNYGAEVTGTVKIEFDDQLNISFFSVEAKSHYDDEKSQWDCAGLYIGLQNKTDWNMYLNLEGESTCNSLTNLYYYHESPPSNNGVIPYSKLIDYFCDENSYIKVTLYKKSIP